ncbi:MAG: hypothetical protein FWG69_01735 [Oscillospiraceae bacterium]|nr:hypothetical protein [Oscillospiraceae bacterium]
MPLLKIKLLESILRQQNILCENADNNFMLTVLLYGDPKDVFIGDMITKELSPNNRIIRTCKEKLAVCGLEKEPGYGRDLFLLESDDINTIRGGVVVLLKNSAKAERLEYISGNALTIVNSGVTSHIKRISQLGAKAVVCGMCGKDAVTFSSISENRGIVSLQRSLPLPESVGGGAVEPFETPLEWKSNGTIDEYSLLAFAVIKIMLTNRK